VSQHSFIATIKRRTRVVRIFSNGGSCLRLVTVLLMEINEDWETGKSIRTWTANERRPTERHLTNFYRNDVAQSKNHLNSSTLRTLDTIIDNAR
jgi:hypothetical protein